MAVYVKFKQAVKFPLVIKNFRNPSRAWKKLKELGAAFNRKSPTWTGASLQNCEVDVSAISVAANATLGRPGVVVPALASRGHR